MIFIPNSYKQLRTRRSRKHINDIALAMGVFDYKTYKNKTLLLQRIQYIHDKPSMRCYNKNDPCTLEDIDSMQLNDLIEWNQCERHFGASICSLKKLIREHHFMLPWSVDFVSGIDKSLNNDFYREKFDLRNVCGLMEYVNTHQCVRCSDGNISSSYPHSFIFEMDVLMNGCEYSYGYMLNHMIHNETHDIYFPLCDTMYNMVTHMMDTHHIYCDVFQQYVYIRYSMEACHIVDTNEHLQFIVDILKIFRDIVGEERATSVIKILFLELSNTEMS